MANELAVEIIIDDGQAKKSFRAFEDAAKSAGKKAGDGLESTVASGLGKVAGVAAAIGAAIVTALGAISFKKAIEESMQFEQALNQFNASLALAGKYSQQASADFVNYANSLEALTGVQDDVILKNSAMLVSVGKLSGDTLKQTTQAALDLAAGLQIDVNTAFDMMAKAATGNAGSLARWGIKIDENLPKSEQFAQALGKVNSAFGGLASARMNTFEGSMAGLTNSFNDFLKVIGDVVTKSPLVAAAVKYLAQWFSNLTDKLASLTSGRYVISEMTMSILKFAQAINTYVMPTVEVMYNGFKFIFDAIVGGLNTMVSGVAMALEALVGGMASFIPGLDGVHQALVTFKDSSALVLQESAAKTNESFANMFNFDATLASENMILKMQEVTATVAATAGQTGKVIGNNLAAGVASGASASNGFFADMAAAMQNTANKMKSSVDLMAQMINTGLVNSVSNGFAAMGAAFVKGDNALKAFAGSFISTLGGMMIQMGTMLIAIGLGLAGTLLFSWAASTHIMAGIGLTIAGGAMQALGAGLGGSNSVGAASAAGAGGGSAGATATGGGIAAAPVTVGENLSTQMTNPEKTAENKIVVNIQGNVLDRRETGLEIANIINETFGSNGIALPAGSLA